MIGIRLPRIICRACPSAGDLLVGRAQLSFLKSQLDVL